MYLWVLVLPDIYCLLWNCKVHKRNNKGKYCAIVLRQMNWSKIDEMFVQYLAFFSFSFLHSQNHSETLFREQVATAVLKLLLWVVCCIFWQAFGYCATQALVKIFIFSVFCAEMLNKCKKITNLVRNWTKKMFFKFASKRWSSDSLPDFKEKSSFLGIKPLTSVLLQTWKTCFLLNLASNLLIFFHFFSFLAQKS